MIHRNGPLDLERAILNSPRCRILSLTASEAFRCLLPGAEALQHRDRLPPLPFRSRRTVVLHLQDQQGSERCGTAFPSWDDLSVE